MTDNDRLLRFLEMCGQLYERMRREGSWPWPGWAADAERGSNDRCGPRDDMANETQPPTADMRGSGQNHAMINAPVLHFDNLSSGSNPALELLTVAETARFLTISRSGVRRLQQARQLPFIKVGGSIRFAKRDLIAYVAKRRVEALDT